MTEEIINKNNNNNNNKSTIDNNTAVNLILNEIFTEVCSAIVFFPPMRSPHEAYAIILEELDELKTHVWTKNGKRDTEKMRHEAIQVAAMAVRFIHDICDNDRAQL